MTDELAELLAPFEAPCALAAGPLEAGSCTSSSVMTGSPPVTSVTTGSPTTASAATASSTTGSPKTGSPTTDRQAAALLGTGPLDADRPNTDWPGPDWPSTDPLDAGASAGPTLPLLAGEPHRVFALRSVTKPITALVTLIAMEAGAVELDDVVFPPDVRLEDLLAQCSGLFYDSARVLSPPRVRREYSNHGFNMIAEHVARAVGEPYPDYARRVLAPLALHDTDLTGSAANGGRTSITDLVAIVREWARPTLIDRSTLDAATTIVHPELKGILPGFKLQDPCPWGLGVEIRGYKSPHWSGSLNSPRTYGHFGMSGACMWVDPDAEVGFAFLTDRMFDDVHRRQLPRLADLVLSRALGVPRP